MSFKKKYPLKLSLLVLICAGCFALLSYVQGSAVQQNFTDWESGALNVMVIYLLFTISRSAVLLALSFTDRFFTADPGEPTAYPLVSIIVPCFNEEVVMEKAVRSVLGLDYPNLEVIVVDDGSTDRTLEIAKKLEEKLPLKVIYQSNQGKSVALNRGIAEALGEFILCVDADSALQSGVIRLGLPYFERDPGLAAVAGSVLIGNPVNWLTKFQRLEYTIGLNFHKAAQSFLSAVTIVPGPVGLFRKSAVLEVGGYRSSTFAEDCDLTLRLLMHGYRTVYCSKMAAITEAPEDFMSLLKQRYRWSRGTLQAIKVNSAWLKSPIKHPRKFLILAYFFVETFVIPTANFIIALAFVQHAAYSENAWMLGAYFVQLSVLEIILAAYSVLMEEQFVSLVFLAAINRFTYGLAMEVLRFAALFDEILALPMNWNKLKRRGI